MPALVFCYLRRQVLVRQTDEDPEIEQTEIGTDGNGYHLLPDIVQQEDQQVIYVHGQPPAAHPPSETITGRPGKEDTRQILFQLAVAGRLAEHPQQQITGFRRVSRLCNGTRRTTSAKKK